jgi:hypothetical protein
MLLAQLDHPDFPGRDLSSIRCAFSGGATVPPTLVCRCRIEGRLKEMIIRGGENIYSREIEQLLHTHPGVADVAIVGMPDDHCGEQVAAFVRPTPGFPVTQDELASFCRAQLAAHKTPRHWIFVDAFPLNPRARSRNSSSGSNSPQAQPLPPSPLLGRTAVTSLTVTDQVRPCAQLSHGRINTKRPGQAVKRHGGVGAQQ